MGLAVALQVTPSAWAQEPTSTPSPKELWEAYPLEPGEAPPTATPSAEFSAAPSATPTSTAKPRAAASDDGGGGVPLAVPIGLAALLALGTGVGVGVHRRRGRPGEAALARRGGAPGAAALPAAHVPGAGAAGSAPAAGARRAHAPEFASQPHHGRSRRSHIDHSASSAGSERGGTGRRSPWAAWCSASTPIPRSRAPRRSRTPRSSTSRCCWSSSKRPSTPKALQRAKLTGELRTFSQTAVEHEDEHVAALQAALGSAARTAPKIDFGDDTADEERFSLAALKLEDLGVAAYTAQAPNLTTPALKAAARIVSVESRHAAWIRDLRGMNPAPTAAEPAIDAQRVIDTLKGSGYVK